MPTNTASHVTLEQTSRPSSAASARKVRHGHARSKSAQGLIGQASWFSSVINLVNTIVGAGVLAMPLAMSHMGLTLGVLVILWAGATAGFGLYLQTRCARYIERGRSSFFALSQMTYPRAAVIFDAAIAIKCFGVGISYLIIIGDLMPGVVIGFKSNVSDTAFLMDRHFWVTAFMLVVIPFSFLRRIDSLKYTSIIAMVSISYLVVLVIVHFAKRDTWGQRGEVHYVHWMGAVPTLASLPVMVFAYTCHQNMFSVLNEMKDNSPIKTTSVVTTSAGSSIIIYVLVSICGYLSFGDNVGGNIIGMYAPSVPSTIGKAAIVVMVMFSYPLQVHPCRASVDAVFKWFTRRRGRSPSHSPPGTAPLLPGAKAPHSTKEGMSETRFAIITTIIIIGSYIVAMAVSSLERVLAYVGATGSTSISFILPGLFYYKISSPDSPHHQRLLKEDDDEEDQVTDNASGSEDEGGGFLAMRQFGTSWRRDLLRKGALALAIYGFLVMVVCLITNTVFIVGGH